MSAAPAGMAMLFVESYTSGTGRLFNCWDDAVAESFFATVEIELIKDTDWHTRAEARRAIFEFIVSNCGCSVDSGDSA